MLSIPQVAQTDADKSDMGCTVMRKRCTCRGQETKVSGATVPQTFAERAGSVSPGLSAGLPVAMAPSAHLTPQQLSCQGSAPRQSNAPCWLWECKGLSQQQNSVYFCSWTVAGYNSAPCSAKLEDETMAEGCVCLFCSL